MVEGTVESKLATIGPHPPACKYKKSISRMLASAAESLGLAAAPTRSLPYRAAAKPTPREKHVREDDMGLGSNRNDVVTSLFWLLFRRRHTRPSCSKPDRWFQRQAHTHPPYWLLPLPGEGAANKVLVPDRRLPRRRKAQGPVN